MTSILSYENNRLARKNNMKKFLPKTINNPQGFTLLELLIAVSILAVLSVIGFAVFNSAQKNSRDARRKADVEAISKALENDFITKNRTVYGPATGTMFAGGVIPTDPGTYIYTYPTGSPASTYTICAQLEAGSGGNSSNNSGTAAADGAFYCLKNQQ